MSDLDAYWDELVTAALLGTDRRDPPLPPDGPVADLVADALRPDGASRMLAAVASVAAVRRAAFVPLVSVDPLQPPEFESRPWCSATAVATWRTVVRDWPVLEDEWVLTVVEHGLGLPPDAVVELLQRHRSDAVRRTRVTLAAGPVARWLVEHVPTLGASSSRSVPVEAVTSLPELPVAPQLHDLLTADAHTFTRRLGADFAAGVYGQPHRAVLVNLIARCRPAVLLAAAETLESTGVGLALALADEARLRHRMLTELGAPT
ncbi:MAG TPA: hypothetical protein VMQ81_06285 [Acidimicrobiia bacterium]|nr:hypothetical protein [Acidimicrobiia bacterium]